MAEEKIERSIAVTAPAEEAWTVLTDVDLLTSWIGIVHDVQELERLKSYKAVLEDRVGPFKLRADLSLDVHVVEEGRSIAVSASGRDRAVDSKITIDALLELVPLDAGTTVELSGRYQVTGKVATMGGGIIRKKADRVLDEFTQKTKERLGS